MPTPTNKEIELREKWNKFLEEYGNTPDENTNIMADWWLNKLNIAVQEEFYKIYPIYPDSDTALKAGLLEGDIYLQLDGRKYIITNHKV